MADLTISPSSGAQQGSTSNPQTVPTAPTVGGASVKSGGVQPGTAQAVLTSQNGLSLNNSALTTVDLAAGANTGTQSRPAPAVKSTHHVNGALIGISIGLIVVAIVLFWTTNRSAKSTTN